MKFREFTKLAQQADQYVAEMCFSGESIPDVPDDYSTHTHKDWLSVLHYYVIHTNDQHQPGQYTSLLRELDAVVIERDLENLLQIQQSFAGINIIDLGHAGVDFEALKLALREAVRRGMT